MLGNGAEAVAVRGDDGATLGTLRLERVRSLL
jgi:hypothetical protein